MYTDQDIYDDMLYGEEDSAKQAEQLSLDEHYMLVQSEPPFPYKLMLLGLGVVGFFLAVFTAWTVFAPIESAVIAKGVVHAASYSQKIQHLEGGIVEQILVQNGQRVAQGQLLLKLRDVQTATALRNLHRQQLETKAIIARLEAEQHERENIEFPPELNIREDESEMAQILASQRDILQTHLKLFRDKQQTLQQKISQKEEHIIGLQGRIKAAAQEKKLVAEQLASIAIALKQGAIPKSDGLALQRREAQLEGDLLSYDSDIKQVQQNIREIQVQITELRAQQSSAIKEELRQNQAQLFALEQKILAAEDILRRTEIIAPISGIAINLRIHTAGGVISAGETLLEILPNDDEFVIDAYVEPKDIDNVRVGMSARIQFTAVNRRDRIPIPGIVAQLSADRIRGSGGSGEGYYQARIKLLAAGDNPNHVELLAGMGAEVFITTGAYSPLQYLLDPITRNFHID